MSAVLTEVMAWETRLGIRRTIVLFVTLWMTYRAFDWAAHYAISGMETNGLEAAAIIAAVTAPITYLQKVVFEAYLNSKGAS
jgi:hypothetical protein